MTSHKLIIRLISEWIQRNMTPPGFMKPAKSLEGYNDMSCGLILDFEKFHSFENHAFLLHFGLKMSLKLFFQFSDFWKIDIANTIESTVGKSIIQKPIYSESRSIDKNLTVINFLNLVTSFNTLILIFGKSN